MIPLLLALAAAPNASMAGPPAPTAAVEARYRACLGLVRTAPEQALAEAASWQVSGGGINARMCNGLALTALERWPEAAAAFEQGAGDADSAHDLSATDFRVQAGNAWLAGGDPAKARAAFDQALAGTALSSELRGEVHLDRGRAGVALDDLAGARRDLDKALELVPGDAFAWYMSAALARRQRDLKRAQDDIAKAVAMAPDDAELLLEAGNIAALSGEVEGARGLYAKAARAAPNSDAGRRAATALGANGSEPVAAPAGN